MNTQQFEVEMSWRLAGVEGADKPFRRRNHDQSFIREKTFRFLTSYLIAIYIYIYFLASYHISKCFFKYFLLWYL